MRDIRYCLHCGKVIQNNNKLYCCAYCQRHSSARAKKCSETYNRFIKLKQLGYSVLYCWENDFKTDKKIIRYFEKDLEY